MGRHPNTARRPPDQMIILNPDLLLKRVSYLRSKLNAANFRFIRLYLSENIY